MKISEILSENFKFLEVKFSIYLNKRVFIMRRLGSLATQRVPCKDSDQNPRTYRLICVFAGCTCTFIGNAFLQLIFKFSIYRTCNNSIIKFTDVSILT